MRKKQTFLALLVGMLFSLTPIAAFADDVSIATYTFGGITNNNAISTAIGEAQLSMTVKNLGDDNVQFIIANSGPEASSIAEIYFDDAYLPDSPELAFFDFSAVSDANIQNMDGVRFQWGDTAPPDLPAGGTVSFVADAGADAGNNAPKTGVNPGEEVSFTFDLANGRTFADLYAALESDPSRFSVGLHVIAFENGESEGFINRPPGGNGGPGDPVPEPATMLLFGTGLLGLAGARRRKK